MHNCKNVVLQSDPVSPIFEDPIMLTPIDPANCFVIGGWAFDGESLTRWVLEFCNKTTRPTNPVTGLPLSFRDVMRMGVDPMKFTYTYKREICVQERWYGDGSFNLTWPTDASWGVFHEKTTPLIRIVNKKDGVSHGQETKFYPSGKVEAIIPWNYGRRDGVEIRWNESGEKVFILEWKDGFIIHIRVCSDDE